jgi:hypothetical protein
MDRFQIAVLGFRVTAPAVAAEVGHPADDEAEWRTATTMAKEGILCVGCGEMKVRPCTGELCIARTAAVATLLGDWA